MKPIFILVITLSLGSCRSTNPANLQARELYPRFQHLSMPEQTFEQLWHHFNNNYAFFWEKGIDWEFTYQEFRPKVSKATSEEELIFIFSQMLNPLKDGHVRLVRQDTNVIQLDRRVCEFARTFKGKLADFQNNIFDVLNKNGFAPIVPQHHINDYSILGYDHLYYYTQSSSLGYLRIVDCRNELEVYDQILQKLHHTQGLIIDLRYNLGGEVGREMAGRLIRETKTFGYKRTKTPKGFTPYAPLRVVSTGTKYTQPVVVLVNDATFSAAEEFALVVAEEEHITLIGTNTGGYFSDVFTYRLPNGMISWLSHEQYFTLDSVLLEDRGVSPDIVMKNQLANLESHRDPLIEKAIEVLSQR